LFQGELWLQVAVGAGSSQDQGTRLGHGRKPCENGRFCLTAPGGPAIIGVEVSAKKSAKNWPLPHSKASFFLGLRGRGVFFPNFSHRPVAESPIRRVYFLCVSRAASL